MNRVMSFEKCPALILGNNFKIALSANLLFIEDKYIHDSTIAYC